MVYSSYETSFMDYSLKIHKGEYIYMASIRDVAKGGGGHHLHGVEDLSTARQMLNLRLRRR